MCHLLLHKKAQCIYINNVVVGDIRGLLTSIIHIHVNMLEGMCVSHCFSCTPYISLPSIDFCKPCQTWVYGSGLVVMGCLQNSMDGCIPKVAGLGEWSLLGTLSSMQGCTGGLAPSGAGTSTHMLGILTWLWHLLRMTPGWLQIGWFITWCLLTMGISCGILQKNHIVNTYIII